MADNSGTLDDSGTAAATKALTGAGSMSGGNDASQTPPFGAPGSVSQQVLDEDLRPPLPPIPPTEPRFIAGPGDRGGTVHGEGEAPGSGWSWGTAGEDSRWTTGATPVTDPGH